MGNNSWVVENLNNALATWNGKLQEIWQLLLTSPEAFRGGSIWGIIVNIHDALKASGFALLVLFFVMGVVKTTTNFSELKRPEHAVRLFLRFAIAKAVVTYGMDLMLFGNIPNGSGLSSSASVEVLTGFILRDMFGFDVTNQDLALIGQYSENNFNGVNCGIMDQFAIAMGKKDHAIFLDTADLSFEYAPIQLEGAKIVIACSNKKRGLGDSKYNERRSECETALAEIQEVVGIKSLGDLTEEQFEQYKTAVKDDVRRKRAKHAVYENQRTIKAVAALKANDIEQFGQLMNASHVSLRDDYEVTGIELDTLVEEAWKIDGVIGSRMTGAGFGGCTVSIVKTDAIDSFIEKVGAKYLKKIGYAADFYVVEIGDGPSVI